MNIAHQTARPAATKGALAQSLRCGTVIAALAVLANTAPSSAAESARERIEIRSCAPVYAQAAEQVYGMGISAADGIEIDYINRADVSAADVTFLVGDESSGTTLVDHGTFAPGTLIRHVFWTGPNVDMSTCRVIGARLRDGAALGAPAAPPTKADNR